MPQTLLDHLLALYPDAKRQTLKRMVEAGRVTINRRQARSLKHPLDPNDTVAVIDAHPRAAKPAPRVQHAALHIVHEDDDLIVVDKPAGLLTSTVPGEPRPTLLAIVKDHVKAKTPRVVGLIHRLDRDVSGLLVFSKNPDAFESLKNQLFKRDMKRVYAAVVVGKPTKPAGTIESRLVELPNGVVRSSKVEDKGERAVTDYQLLTSAGDFSLLRITLHTGRKHQIRVHLSEKKLPILGDPTYNKSGPAAPRLMLAAIHLSFTHPKSGKPMKFELPLPKEFKDALKQQ